MSHEIEVRDLPVVQNMERPMTAQEVTNQSLVVHQILTSVMQENVHYGVVPGTEKPTLLQPGAEKICTTFRLAPKYEVEDLSEPHNNLFRFRVKCSLYTIKDSYFVGSAVGSATSLEEKHQWERAVCQEHWDTTDPTRRRVKYKRANNAEGFEKIIQVQRNAADLENTVLKIAAKRAFISATRGATAASDLLDVDMEEEVNQTLHAEQEPPKAKLKAKPSPAPKLPFGRSKGKAIDDPAVPAEDLTWMMNALGEKLNDPARAQWKAKDKLMIDALKAELAKRQLGDTAAAAAEGLKEAQHPSIADGEWADLLIFWEEEAVNSYRSACDEFAVPDAHQLAPSRRAEFRDSVQKRIKAAKQR
jgi:hypothetical protein